MRFGSWRFERVIAHGKASSIFQVASHAGERAALKLLRVPTLAREFAGELAASKCASMAGASPILDEGATPSGEPFFVLERLLGRTLAKHASARGGRFDLVTSS